MLDRTLIEQSDSATRLSVKQALRTLAESGIFLRQKEQLESQLLSGPDDEDVQAVAGRVLEYRKMTRDLLTLHQLGESFEEEANQ